MKVTISSKRKHTRQHSKIPSQAAQVSLTIVALGLLAEPREERLAGEGSVLALRMSPLGGAI